MPLALRVFEDRYLVMLSRVLQDEPSEFGVVLIERGQEVGGGEKRFSVGTIATIVQLDTEEGAVGLLAQGGRRVTITRWLDEDPYPQAEAELLPDFEWDDGDAELLARANEVVRRALALASEFTESLWSPDVELSGDPVESAWQLAAIAPLGPIDQFALLRSESVRDLLDGVITLTLAASETLTMAWTDDEAPDAADDEPRDR